MGEKAKVHKTGHQWPKGVSGNPSGRPKLPAHLRAISKLDADTLNRMLNKYAQMTREEIKAAIQDPQTPILELSIASALMDSVKEGDFSKLEPFFNRTIGKVAEAPKDVNINMNLAQLPKHEVIELGKEAIKFLEAEVEDDDV